MPYPATVAEIAFSSKSSCWENYRADFSWHCLSVCWQVKKVGGGRCFINILTKPHADFCQLLNTCVNMAAAKSPNGTSAATRASYLWTFRSSAVIRTWDWDPSSSFTNNSHWPGEHGHSSLLSILRQECFPSRLRETSYWMFAATPPACWWHFTEKWVTGAYLDDGGH